MRIKNNHDDTIHWRAFGNNDKSYIIGLKQGVVKPGQTDSWRDDSYPKIKVEAKTGDIVFSSRVLAAPGAVFDMSDDLLVTGGGITVAAVRLLSDRGQRTEQRSDLQFIDLRGFNAQVERSLSSKFETAFANTESFDRSAQHEQTWTVGGKIGGMVGKKDTANAGAELSVQFQDKVVNSLKETSTETVTTVWSQTWNDKLVLAGGKLYVIEVVWTVTLDRGTATYFGEKTTFSVVRSATPSLLKPSQYDRPEDLPPAYLRKWTELSTSTGS
jgi:hypothetical protein